jgi:hypothetical protein
MITSPFSIVVDECTTFDRRQDKPIICTHLDYGLVLGFILHMMRRTELKLSRTV